MRAIDLNQRVVFICTLGTLLMWASCHGATQQQDQIQTRHALSSPTSFAPDMAFGRAIDILRHAADPPLPIIVLWKDLDRNADIDRQTPIGMDGVSGVSLRTHLDLLLLAVSADSPDRLTYTVRQGVITIGTQGNLPAAPVSTKVYYIADVMSRRVDSLLVLPWVRAGLMMSLAAPLPPVIAWR
jgi:hypothetical protein